MDILKDEDKALLAGFFNENYYARHNSDVVSAGVDLAAHYVNFGWREGREPSEHFDGQYYLRRYADVSEAGLCPLIHYLRYGLTEGRFVSARMEYASAVHTQDQHMVHALKKMLKMAYPFFGEMNENFLNKYVFLIFSPEFYRTVKELGPKMTRLELLMHYIVYGLPEGVPPGPLFDATHYLQQLKDMQVVYPSDMPPFHHWLLEGPARRISPTPLFSEKTYLARNADLVDYPFWLLDHFLEAGTGEGRQFISHMQIGPNAMSSVPSLAPPVAMEFLNSFDTDPRRHAAAAALQRMDEFWTSDLVNNIFARANSIEAYIGGVEGYSTFLAPPWHDGSYAAYKTFRNAIPEGSFDDIVFVPFCKLGGADFVAGVLVKSLVDQGRRVLILRTEQSDWARPDWFPGAAESVDASIYLNRMEESAALRALYAVIKDKGAAHIYNVNSYRCFKLLEKFGRQLKTFTQAHVYYFCSDRDENGFEVGYPVWFFTNILNDLSTAIFDTNYLRSTLTNRYALVESLARKTLTIYTPAMSEPFRVSVAVSQVETRASREKPILLWAGRLDRQKRFDLVVEIATKMPDIEFQCWGKAVLDSPPDVTSLPENLYLNGTFKDFNELPLEACDGWLYTSEWDGLPTILIECAAIGMPMVASAVGGVPELITPETGWMVDDINNVDAYVDAIRDMLSDAPSRVERADRARELVTMRHNLSAYTAEIARIIGD